jgi:hypothetical protein
LKLFAEMPQGLIDKLLRDLMEQTAPNDCVPLKAFLKNRLANSAPIGSSSTNSEVQTAHLTNGTAGNSEVRSPTETEQGQ